MVRLVDNDRAEVPPFEAFQAAVTRYSLNRGYDHIGDVPRAHVRAVIPHFYLHL